MQEDWGERYTGKRAPGLFVLDLRSWRVHRLKGTPQESSVGQPVWSPSGGALTSHFKRLFEKKKEEDRKNRRKEGAD